MHSETKKIILLVGGAAMLLFPGRAKAKVARVLKGQTLNTFSGRRDLYDRAYDQAYLLEPRRPDGAEKYSRLLETPAQYYARIPQWQQNLLRPEMAKAVEWPVLSQHYYRAGDVKNKVTRQGPVGVSYWMNESVPTVAWKLRNEANKRLARKGLLYAEITYPGGFILAHVVDDGPSGIGQPVFDVSRVVHDAVNPYWPAYVQYRLVEGYSTNQQTMGDRGIKKNPDAMDIEKERLPQPM